MNDTLIAPTASSSVEAELRLAMEHPKCRRCGCYQEAVRSFDGSSTLKALLPGMIEEALTLFEPVRYDCLGCDICWPAVASNAAAEIDPVLAEASHCATAEPILREGWPPLPGDYKVLRFHAPVAVCALNSDELVTQLAAVRPPGMAIVGTMHTENLGIEHVIRNLLPNPNIRFLLVCGEDTRKAIGHLPGQSLVSLMDKGLDENRRIVGAAGKRPMIKNVSPEHVDAFRRRIEVIDLIGETNIEALTACIAEAAGRDPGADQQTVSDAPQIAVEQAVESKKLVSDPAGYLVVYADRLRNCLALEHYTNAGLLTRVFEGDTSTALYGSAIAAGLISRLDHAAYLGRELSRAEEALRDGSEYVQDRAPGKSDEETCLPATPSCGCSTGCH